MGRAGRMVLVFLAAATGCDEEVEDDVFRPPDDTGHATLFYFNGHPLDWVSDRPETLAAEDEVLALVNAHRASIGRSALVHDPAMRRCARGHSRHMRADVHDFYAHVNPEGDDPGDRLKKNGVAWLFAGENLVAGSGDPLIAFAAWMDSPGHRANLEDARWTRTGVGYQPGTGAPSYDATWTQLFAD